MSYTKEAILTYVYSPEDLTPEQYEFCKGMCIASYPPPHRPCDCPQCLGPTEEEIKNDVHHRS